MNIRRIFYLSVAVIFAFVLLLKPAPVLADYNPAIAVDYNQGAVALWGWTVGTELTLTIDNPANGIGVDYTTSMIPETEPSAFYLNSAFNIQPGDIVVVTDGSTTRQVTVAYVRISGANPDTDMVYGKADPSDTISVYTYNTCPFNGQDVTADENGNWSANFTGLCDLIGKTTVIATRQEDGPTRFVFDMPIFTVYPQSNRVDSYIWQVGDNVTLTIDDPTNGVGIDYTDTKTTSPLPPDPYNTYLNFDLGTFQIHAGDIVTMTDGTTIKTTVVTNLTFGGVNVINDRVWGTAAPGTIVKVLYQDNPNVFRNVTADTSGNWLADFSVPGDETGEETTFDIQAGNVMLAVQKDGDGDQTQLEWRASTNFPPQIASISAPLVPVRLGQNIEATAVFSDGNEEDSHTIVWDWGDNSSTTSPATVPSMTASHLYAEAGIYAITATITDEMDASNSDTFENLVIYNPNGGFVTGNGWINLPTGKATFDFNSKYRRGAHVPIGDTEFKLHASHLNFKSTSYDWLVITGNEAKYKGTGKINGRGNYGFMLTATDDSPDKFQIKIWNKATGATVFDNPTTALGGGAIVIHK